MNKSSAAPGKLIIIGEYAVLYGAQALVTSINRYSRIKITPSLSDESEFIATNLADAIFKFRVSDTFEIEFTIPVPSSLNFARHAIEYAFNFLKENENIFRPCTISADTADFYFRNTGTKLGLGSSAAFSVAVLHALLEFNAYPLSHKDLFKMSQDVHFTAQGRTGSGIDIAASVYGGMIKYKMSHAPDSIVKINKNNNVRMIFIWTGESTTTPDMLTILNEFQQKRPGVFVNIIDRLKELAEEGCQKYGMDITSFFKVIKEYYLQMKILGEQAGIPIISKNHCTIAQKVMETGAVYKPSGAGGGDLGIAFCTEENYPVLRKRLLDNHVNIIDLETEDKGVHLIDV